MLQTFSMGFKSAAFAGNRAARNRCLAIQRCVRLALCPVCLSWYSVCFRVDMTGSNPSSSTLQYSFALTRLDTTFKSEARSIMKRHPRQQGPGFVALFSATEVADHECRTTALVAAQGHHTAIPFRQRRRLATIRCGGLKNP